MTRGGLVGTIVVLLALGCRSEKEPGTTARDEGWSVTAWGERYEVFPECDPLIAEAVAICNAHVTVLEGFKPLVGGSVSVVLRGAGPEQVYRQDHHKRDGIFPVELRPVTEGPFELLFRIEGPAGPEEIAAGRVQVGHAASPGGLVGQSDSAPVAAVPFLKEQQWKTEFATAPVAEGSLAESVSGPGRVAPAAGGEVALTAAYDATVASHPWPYAGLDVKKGSVVFRLQPRVGERSLPELRAEASALEAETEAARRRVERLRGLLASEATSPAEMERAQATLTGLEARLKAARQGAGTEQSGAAGDATFTVVAPWAGRVAEVTVTPGQTVAAGAALARLVTLRPLWVVLALRPADAARVQGKPSGLLLRRPGSPDVLSLGQKEVRVVSRSPEVDPRTASVAVIVEIDRSATDLAIGSGVEADLLLGASRPGIVVPLSALVDDAGVLVVYVQIAGERFARREVKVLERQGDQALVAGLRPGERLVTVGGGAIRRAALLSSGAPEGHVH